MNTSMSSVPLNLQAQTFHFFRTFRLIYYLPISFEKMWENGSMDEKKKSEEQGKEKKSFRTRAVPVSEAASSRRLRKGPRRSCCP